MGYTSEPDSLQRFRGSPDKLYLRFRSSTPGDYSVGFTVEKDPGEKYFMESQAIDIMDLIMCRSMFRFKTKEELKNLIVGDFQGQFAQGIMLGGGFGTGKGSETILTSRRSNIGVMPYTSVNEAGFLRGVAATLEVSTQRLLNGLLFESQTRRKLLKLTRLARPLYPRFSHPGFIATFQNYQNEKPSPIKTEH